MDVEILIDQLRMHMEQMTSDERIQVFEELMDGYCRECGCRPIGNACSCTHDE